jgi:hypothetical protein
MIERSLIFGALESPSHFRSDLEEIRWQLAEFEWLKALAEASPFCWSWLIVPQLCPRITYRRIILDHGDDRVADRIGKRRSGFSATRDSRRNILTAAATFRSG